MGFLDSRERAVASRFANLMEQSGDAIQPFVLDILPVYYHGDKTLDPQGVYRSLMYVYTYAHVGDSRGLILMAGEHLESCLECLGGYGLPLGKLIDVFHEKNVISSALATKLFYFNKVVFVPAKHMGAINRLESDINRRTFSYVDAACAFMMMRKFSIALFAILKSHGVSLSQKIGRSLKKIGYLDSTSRFRTGFEFCIFP